MSIRLCAFAPVLLLSIQSVFAANMAAQSLASESSLPEPAPSASSVTPLAATKDPAAKSSADKTSDAAFAGAWNGAFAVLHNQETLIPQATLVKLPNGTYKVEATQTEEYHPEVMLAYHWYLAHTDNGTATGCSAYLAGICGGLFLAAGLGTGQASTNTVDTIIGGLVIGWGGASCDVENQKYNIGWGWGHRFAVSTLGDGFYPNQPPPNGETQARYQTKDIRVNGLFFTYTWGASSADCKKT